jgi:hypothetical protein
VRTKFASGRAWVEPDANLPGTHRPEGVVAVCAQGVRPGRSLAADLIDIAPSVLDLMGVEIPPHIEGRPLACLASLGRQRKDNPTQPYAGMHAEPTRGSNAEFEYSDEEQAIIEQRLADLGYLE